MKNTLSKIVGLALFVGADIGVMAGICRFLSAIYQKHEITEDYVNDHPRIAILRLMLRTSIMIAAVMTICVAPAGWFIDKISDFCDKYFPVEVEKKEEKDWEE